MKQVMHGSVVLNPFRQLQYTCEQHSSMLVLEQLMIWNAYDQLCKGYRVHLSVENRFVDSSVTSFCVLLGES